jgi:hypothetical protein
MKPAIFRFKGPFNGFDSRTAARLGMPLITKDAKTFDRFLVQHPHSFMSESKCAVIFLSHFPANMIISWQT